MNKMNEVSLTTKEKCISYLGAFLFIMMMVGAAYYYQDSEIILPEIAAMAVAMFAFREQSWMKQPDKIFILPSITAIFGFGINTLEISYVLKLSLVLAFMLMLMYFIKYNLAPSLATGFLPIVSHCHSFSFIASILITTFLLMVIVLIFKLNKHTDRKSKVDKRKMMVYFAILMVWMLLTNLFNFERLSVIPPVAVVVYESLHMKMYSLKMAIKQTAVLFLSASIGVLLFLNIDNWLIVAGLDLLCMYGLLQLFKMKIPAVYAFPFLAFILPHDVVVGLPLAGLSMSIFAFGCLLLWRKYEASKAPMTA